MPSVHNSDALQLRKQLLLLESELNRVALREDFARIRDRTAWLGALEQGLRPDAGGGMGGSWWLKAAPIAGLVASAAAGPSSGWVKRGLRLVQLAATAYPLWKAFTASRGPDSGEPG